MAQTNVFSLRTVPRDFVASVVVFFVALPLCLGVALASNAPLFSGLVAGIVGGIVVGLISGSHSSVSGPAAGLTAIVFAQLAAFQAAYPQGAFQMFLLALVVAGFIQVVLGCIRAGFIAAFFPSSVIKGLLAAIGVILILKQLPHVIGHDTDPEGEMGFQQPDHENTFSELAQLIDFHPGAATIGLLSIALLIFWDRFKSLKKSVIPAPLVVVVLGVALNALFKHLANNQQLDASWLIGASHLVQVPVAKSLQEFASFLTFPDFAHWANPLVYTAGMTIALVASLETLLNLEAVDKLDPQQRSSPPNRELLAQGIGNMTCGLLGGIPITSVIVRSSVNINAGGQTKLATIFHGVLLLVCVMFLPVYLNLIPLSCLAAILLVTGIKLVSPKLIMQMWKEGRYQFLPFAITVIAIVLTDLVIGILIGLAVSVGFILNSNLRRPIRRFVERHLGGDVLHIELANQVSFLHRAALAKIFDETPRGGHVLIDAHDTDYIDPDVLDLIRDFKETMGPARGVEVSLLGFRFKYQLQDQIQYVDYSTRELQSKITAQQVLEILKQGNERFRSGKRLTRDLGRQVNATAQGQHPLAVVLSCIDSRAPAELVFDLGLGDIFSVRMAGNIISRKVLGSMEYGCAVAGAKLVLVMGHTRCGAVTTAVNMACSAASVAQVTGCQHAEFILRDIQESIDSDSCQRLDAMSESERHGFVDAVARANVLRSVRMIMQQSETLGRLVQQGRIGIVGALYDVSTGRIEFMEDEAIETARANRTATFQLADPRG